MDLSKYQAQWVELGRISFDNKAFQFRKDITPESVAELGRSLAQDGQKLPVIVWVQGGTLQLVCGYRRISAARTLGWDKVLAIVIPEADMSEEEALKLNFIENIERKTLNSLDIMFACKKLKDQGKTNERIGGLIGKTEGQVRRYIKVVEASADAQDKLKAGDATIKEAAGEKIVPGYDSPGQNKKMYVKPTKTGFLAMLRFDRKHDNPAEAIAFIASLQQQIKEQGKIKAKEARSSKAGRLKSKSTSPLTPPLAPPSTSIPVGEQSLLTPIARGEDVTQGQVPGMAESMLQFLQEVECGKVPVEVLSGLVSKYELMMAATEQQLNTPGLAEAEAAKLKGDLEMMRSAVEGIKKKLQ